MQHIELDISDVRLLEPRVFSDSRGFFMESYNQKVLEGFGISVPFVQDNHSHSSQGVLRGLHYQLQRPQGKLVRVTWGEAYDVAVDLRKSSPSFGRWVGVHLSAENKRIFWVPPGFAHGFLVLSPKADFLYKTTEFYDPSSEYCISWNDPDLKISWPLHGKEPLQSPKDSKGISFRNAPYFS
jgi:dTDP-4-dehydrorhamnose 3,5-epimerase